MCSWWKKYIQYIHHCTQELDYKYFSNPVNAKELGQIFIAAQRYHPITALANDQQLDVPYAPAAVGTGTRQHPVPRSASVAHALWKNH